MRKGSLLTPNELFHTSYCYMYSTVLIIQQISIFLIAIMFYICNSIGPELKKNVMKKAALLIVIVFAIGLVMSSCSKEACPAYSQQDTDQFENLG